MGCGLWYAIACGAVVAHNAGRRKRSKAYKARLQAQQAAHGAHAGCLNMEVLKVKTANGTATETAGELCHVCCELKQLAASHNGHHDDGT